MILYINSCVRNQSRTDKIARALLGSLGEYQEVNLEKAGLKPLDREALNHRAKLVEKRCFDNAVFSFAKQFAAADTIVIAAPFWDGSFPASLKTYFENIYIIGLVTDYTQEGTPYGLCRAKKLYYVTTAGGKYIPDFSYDYIKHLTVKMFGVKETELIYAENLDIAGNDSERMVNDFICKNGWHCQPSEGKV